MKALLSIGSNVGNRKENIEAALRFLTLHASEINYSPVYESPDCRGSHKRYLNAVVDMETEVDAERLNREIKRFEIERGRDEQARERKEVPVDIDIVMWDGNIKRMEDYRSAYFQKGLEFLRHP